MRPAFISVVVATYNWPQALDRVLAGLAEQDDSNFEVVVADDGSGPETAALIARWKPRLGVPLVHAWQEDEGFRLSRSRNNGVRQASGDYLVFLDGDCIPRRDFVSGHRRAAQAGCFVRGWRVFLTPEATRDALSPGAAIHRWSAWRLFRRRRRLMTKPSHAPRLFGWPPARIVRRWWDRETVEGCNLAMWRDDFLRVGGFDESYQAYGEEDLDMALRLLRTGLTRKDARHTVTVLHLHHEQGARADPVNPQLEAARARTGFTAVASMFVSEGPRP